jgi:uncharacterized protein (UPF0332 family)
MNQEVLALFGKAKESLEAARLLLEKGYNNFAASRAYYAMFYVAEALLASLGQSYSSHGAVQAAFGREFAKTGKLDLKYHRWLIDAQDFRNLGDYALDKNISPAQATEICSWAEEFILKAEEYFHS